MKTYAYCRVSTERQSLQRQIDNITAAFPEISPKDYHTDKFTGATQDRPAWNKLLQKVQAGDTIVFDSVSRMSRDAAEGAKQYEELYNKGIRLIFLAEPHINTDVFKTATERQIQLAVKTGSYAFDKACNGIISVFNELAIDLAKEQVRIAFEQAEKERKDICKRVKDGMKASGNMGGRKQGFTYTSDKVKAARAQIEKHAKEFGGTLKDTEIMQMTGISRDTLYRLKREIRAERTAAE
jgi:DNA invertase Pin-like site-specific DNA recombinase